MKPCVLASQVQFRTQRSYDAKTVSSSATTETETMQAESPGFASLKPHQDESTFSITVALNDRDAYEEGGLWIASAGDVLNGDAGTTLCFCGDIVHGGYPVRRGTRCRIWTVFLYTDTNRSGKKPGYVLEQQLADV